MMARTLQVLLFFALALGLSLGTPFTHPSATKSPTGTDYGCSQNPDEQSALIGTAEAGGFTVRRVEFLGNATTRHNVLAKRLFFVEGDIFTKQLLERSVKNLSRLRVIKPVQLNDVEVRLVSEYREIDILFCVQERKR